MNCIGQMFLRTGALQVLRIALGLALFISIAVEGKSASLTASLEPQTVVLGEQATLTLTFNGNAPQKAPAFPNVPGLQVAGTGQFQSVNIVNGRASSTTTFTYSVRAQRTGEFTIPAIAVNVGGEQLTTQPLKLTVTPPGSSVASAAGDQLVILTAEIPKKEVFVGEVFTIQLKVHLHSSIQNIGNFQITSLQAEGFNVGKMADGERSRVQIGNTLYTVIPITIAMTAVRNDTLMIGPIAARMVVELPSRRRDVFGMFDRDQREVNVATEPQTIQALALPAGDVPAGFNGAIGNYQLSFGASPTNIAAGDPITVKVEISGRGSFDAISLPEQKDWKEFKTYPATSKIETTDPLGIAGSKTFEQVVVPQNTEITALPQFAFSFFDPDKRQYQTLKAGPVSLTVRPTGFTPAPTLAGAKTETPAPAADILPIRQRPGLLAVQCAPLIAQPGFLALQSVPVLALLAAMAWRKRCESLANNPRLRRQRQVAQIVRDGLAELRKRAAENNSDAFFATVFRLLQEQLGERLDVPAASITEAVIEERLRPRGVPESTLTSVHELFQACNLARYAPIKSSHELAAFVPRVETALREVAEVKL